MSCALRVNTATSSPPVPRWGRAAKRGWCSVAPSPFAARCCAMLGCLWCGRCAVLVCGVVRQAASLLDVGAASLPPHPGLVRSWLRHHRAELWGGGFPLTPPNPLAAKTWPHPFVLPPPARATPRSRRQCGAVRPAVPAGQGSGRGRPHSSGRLRRLLFVVVRSRLRRHRAAVESKPCPDGHPGEWRRLPLSARSV